MTIILAGGEKGGSGKTTVAVQTIARLVLDGHKALLVDCDKQASSALWATNRKERGVTPIVPCVQLAGASIDKELLKLSGQYDVLVVDAGGRDSVELRAALLVADIFITPIQPAQYDMWTLETMVDIVTKAKAINPQLRVTVVLNRAPANASSTEALEAISALSEFPEIPYSGVIIRDRVVCRKSAISGQSVWEFKPQDRKAINEFTDLINWIENHEQRTEVVGTAS